MIQRGQVAAAGCLCLLWITAGYSGLAAGQVLFDMDIPRHRPIPPAAPAAATAAFQAAASSETLTGGHPVPGEHPRLFGSRQRLQQLARERPEAYRRVVSVAAAQPADEWSKLVFGGSCSCAPPRA